METKRKIYFMGAGGIGMSALERYFLSQGWDVAGYDRTPSELTSELRREGIEITFDDSVEAIPERFRTPNDTLVVYTPAVPEDHPAMQYFRSNGFEMMKRAKVLGLVTRRSKAICFAGTHGKTTTSSMAAHLLHSGSTGCNAFLGGILRNYGSNLLLNTSSPWSVIEADEFDRSFHQLKPHIAVITATDPDHLDIYGSEEAYLESFAHFTSLIDPDGALVVHTGLKLTPRTQPGVRTYTYGIGTGDFRAENIERNNGRLTFDFVAPDMRINDIELGVPVDINVDNAVAALSAVYLTGSLEEATARTAMASFMGPKRRFETLLREPGPTGRVIIDDYAHHPDELKASINSVKALYGNRKLTVAFQPHLYTRTRDFAPEFAEALSAADSVVLLDIYPARELPIPGITSKVIFDAVTAPSKQLITKAEFISTMSEMPFDILLCLGAGDMSDLLPDLISRINNAS